MPVAACLVDDHQLSLVLGPQLLIGVQQLVAADSTLPVRGHFNMGQTHGQSKSGLTVAAGSRLWWGRVTLRLVSGFRQTW
jgi:hypothetical protein